MAGAHTARLGILSTVGGSTDPLWGSVTYMVTGPAEGGTTFTDETGNIATILKINTPEGDSGVQLQGGNSILLDGSELLYYAGDGGDPHDFKSGDFTIDVAFQFTSISGFPVLVSKYDSFNNQRAWRLMHNAGANQMQFLWSTAGTSASSTTFAVSFTPSTGTPYHVRVCRNGSTLRMWINGVYQDQASISGTIFDSSEPIRIGAAQTSGSDSNFFPGNIAEVRITKAARNTTNDNFTNPTTRWPRSA